MKVLLSSPRQTRSILVDLPSRKSGPVSRSRYSTMSSTFASGGRRTLSRPMSWVLLLLSANTALKPASSVRSTYRPGTTVDLAAVLLLPPAFARLSPPLLWPTFLPPLALPLTSPLPASVPLPFPLSFPSCFCPTASPPAESFLKFFIVFCLNCYAAMIVHSRLTRNKETSKDERNRKICAGRARSGCLRSGVRIARLEHFGFSIL